MITTDAWVLHAGSALDNMSQPVRGTLSREKFSFPDVAADEVLVEPLYGSWEANLEHGISRQPIDLCRERGEDPIVLGNLGVVRVLSGGSNTSHREGAICMVMPFGKMDPHGYAETVYAYEEPGTIGLLAKRTKVKADMLLPIPEDSPFSIAQWAAYARYFTAWDNWQVAHGCWMTQMRDVDPESALVFGWGGGVVFAELELARRAGFRVGMTASSDNRLAYLAKHNFAALDRRLFSDLYFEPDKAQEDAEYITRHRASEDVFVNLIGELSDGFGAAIFIDNIGSPLYRAALKALARQGVLATVGWKHGMRTSNLRASECIKRHLHVNTHVWRYDDCALIRDYQESTGWFPVIDEDYIYDFDDVPRLVDAYSAGQIDTYFPLFRVNGI
jgi:NADPH:quinone reductase-like Zn-dependent oxidoreductase